MAHRHQGFDVLSLLSNSTRSIGSRVNVSVHCRSKNRCSSSVAAVTYHARTGEALMHNRSCRRFALISLLIYTISAASYASSEDWPKFLRDLNNSANSAETGIDSSNVSTLRAKWVFSTGYEVSASPAVATIKGEPILYL